MGFSAKRDCMNDLAANQKPKSSLVLAELSTGNTINQNHVFSGKNSAAPKWFICVAQDFVVVNL